MKRVCLVCKKEFEIRPSQIRVRGGGKYCSRVCLYSRSRVYIECLACNTRFAVSPSRQKTAKYCSTRCQYSKQKSHHWKLVKCAECDKSIRVSPRRIKRAKNLCCSYRCSATYRSKYTKVSGPNNPNWRGGITPINQLVRTSRKYLTWRKAVFERDNFICQLCGTRGGRLEADHLDSFSQHPGRRFDLDNGRTLCKQCHQGTNNYGSRAINRVYSQGEYNLI